MVTRITFPKSVAKALNYNEQKQQQGKAMCIGGNGTLINANELNFYQKLAVLENRNSLNDRATTKTLHISLNFSPIEEFSATQFMEIATDYLHQLGFAEQPYFVYQHEDAGHPHLHILTSCIRSDGTRINTHNIGRNQSEFARKYVEAKHGLEKAENNRLKNETGILPFRLEKLEYGKSEIRRGLAVIVQAVYGTYNFTSLPEYNAILKQFNVLADRGKEESFTYQKNGLMYRVLDAQGEKIGVPIKASALPGNPGLKNLSARYEINRKHREPLKQKLKHTIDTCITKSPADLMQLKSLLEQEKVKVLTRQNESGRLYGITFVDMGNRSVFNGSEIGKSYSVSGILKQLNGSPKKQARNHWIHDHPIEQNKGVVEFNGWSMATELIYPIQETTHIPYHLRKRKKKIRRS